MRCPPYGLADPINRVACVVVVTVVVNWVSLETHGFPNAREKAVGAMEGIFGNRSDCPAFDSGYQPIPLSLKER